MLYYHDHDGDSMSDSAGIYDNNTTKTKTITIIYYHKLLLVSSTKAVSVLLKNL